MFIDSHCHLDGHKYDVDRAAVLARATEAGVEAVLAIGIGEGPAEANCAIKIAEQFDPVALASSPAVVAPSSAAHMPRIYASTGIHPHEARLADEAAYTRLAELARHPRVIAWGEIGLDYWYDYSPREVQREVFVRQMELARAARKPIIIHCRNSKSGNDAWKDTIRLMRLNWASTGLGGILHCFSGSLEHMRTALDLGFMISFAGNVTYPKADELRAVAREVPLDRLLIETDAPFLAPVPHRGKRNEPAYVVETAHCIGNLRQMLTEEVGQQTAANFRRFFKLE